MKANRIAKTIISTGLVLLAATCVLMLITAKLDTYQQCFLVGTMSVSGLLILGLNKEA